DGIRGFHGTGVQTCALPISRTFRNLAEIENPAENLVGIASAGSEGAITARQLAVRPVNRATEVLETVPGLIISQHSGEGKANQRSEERRVGKEWRSRWPPGR